MSDVLKKFIWSKSLPACYPDNPEWRVDFCGRLMQWSAYGDRTNPYGWELGHIQAKAEGGPDSFSNLQAENWQTNLEKEELRRNRQQIADFFTQQKPFGPVNRRY